MSLSVRLFFPLFSSISVYQNDSMIRETKGYLYLPFIYMNLENLTHLLNFWHFKAFMPYAGTAIRFLFTQFSVFGHSNPYHAKTCIIW